MDFSGLISYQFTPWQWAVIIFSCICFGMSKTGINGISAVAVPLFALIFGAKESTGIVLPLLCFADLFAVVYYRRHAEWKYVIRLVPWALAGFVLALWVDSFISSNRGFKILIGICVLAGLGVMIWSDIVKSRKKGNLEAPAAWWFAALFGIMGGFSTMIGNAAGPIMSIFLLSMRLPKTGFIGTAAWFFLIINYLKIPLQLFFWHNITVKTLAFDLAVTPFILVGIWLGILFVKKVSESQYRIAVYALTIASALLLFL
ncbi:MAG: sulfite exporter TauE/SafE family protein [Treponema sp.]|jgi:uncharacterized membrane protein YfcA|nr:sulfite exporter TauE/SafE family protein [Treponema sp.]